MSAPTDADRLSARIRPVGCPVMRQTWTSLLFLHWAWDPAFVQNTLPPGLRVDTFNSKAWLGVVPFFMSGVRPPYCPPLPGLSTFLELNVRTYVFDAQGRPGVWFYSLDANQWLAVEVARAWFHLPYQHAAMTATVEADGSVDYSAWRKGAERASRFRWKPAAAGRESAPASLEFFLMERYRLFAHDADRGRLFTGLVAHRPYRVSAVDMREWDDGMLQLAGFDPAARKSAWTTPHSRGPDHVCAASDLAVEVFALEQIAEPAGFYEATADRLGEGALPT
jgi:uncharacterized protein YqjF (DUF2071 family)